MLPTNTHINQSYRYIRTLLEQLVAPIRLDGHIGFEPIIHLSVVATTPRQTFICLTHGRIVSKESYQQVAEHITTQLYALVQRDSFRKVRPPDRSRVSVPFPIRVHEWWYDPTNDVDFYTSAVVADCLFRLTMTLRTNGVGEIL